MCQGCGGFDFDDIFGGARGGRGVSDRAMDTLSSSYFLNHLKTVDISRGTVSHEIIRFHLVSGMRKEFSQYVKQFGCTATSRQLTREEQDRFYKNRKSLIYFTSVQVTPQAQQAYFAKNPSIPRPATLASVPVSTTPTVNATGPSTSSQASSSRRTTTGPLLDFFNKKAKQKLNQAAVNHAALNPSVKKVNTSLKKKK